MDSMEPFDFKPIDKESQEEIIRKIREQLSGGNKEQVRRAMLGLGWLESGEQMVEPLLELARGGDREIAVMALEGLGRIGSKTAERPLARLVLDSFRGENLAGHEVRAEAIRALGKTGGKESVGFLAEMIGNPAPAELSDKEAAVEALVSQWDRGIEGASKSLEELEKESTGELAKILKAAVRELHVQQWEDEGYLTIEADLDQQDEESGEE